jgi:thiol:disulfide interchange protein DsbD
MILINFNIKPGYYLYQSKLSFETSNGEESRVMLPEGIEKEDEFFGKQIIYNMPITAQVNFKNKLKDDSSLIFSYQGCSERGLCYPPQKITIKISSLESSINNSDKYRKALNSNIYIALLLFFIGGVLLSLTPCVLPLVPVLLAMLSNLNKNKISATAFYVLGICVTYTIIGIFAALTGNLISIYLQNDYVILISAILFIIFALSMFGLFEITIPSRFQTYLNKKTNAISGNRYIGIFFLGMISSLILSPCVAPPLASAIVYISQTGNVVLGGTSLFLMALGMSLPLLVIGISSKQINQKLKILGEIPKIILGFILLTTAIFVAKPVIPTIVAQVLYHFLFLIFLLYLLIKVKKISKPLKVLTTTILVIFFSISIFQQVKSYNTIKQNQLDFIEIKTVEELNLIKENNKPTIIDFYADWCVACLELEKYTFSDKNVQEKLINFNLIKVDVTNFTSQDKEIMREFNIFGPPAIIFFNDQGNELKELQLNGYLDANSFISIIENIE